MQKPKYADIERKYGKPLRELLPELMEQHGSVSAIAKALNVSQGSVSFWIKLQGLKLKTIIISDDATPKTA